MIHLAIGDIHYELHNKTKLNAYSKIVGTFILQLFVLFSSVFFMTHIDDKVEPSNIFEGIMFIVGGLSSFVGIMTLGFGFLALIMFTGVQYGKILCIIGIEIENLFKIKNENI